MNRFLLPGLAGGMLLATLASSVHAVDATTPAVKGRAPVVSNVVIINQSRRGDQPRVGDVLRGTYNFLDADGDRESDTTYQWWRGSTPIGRGIRTYTLVVADVRQSLTVEVTPKTDPQTTDPSSGRPVISVGISVLPANVGNFLGPDAQLRNWQAANNYCQGLGNGARLPTRNELQQLFIEATSSTALGQINIEMCSKYGWPLNGQCGGSINSLYWSSTPGSASRHEAVNLSYGHISILNDSGTYQVACVR